MAFGFVAFHYPAPEHLEEFVRKAHQVADASRRQPGFLSVEVWVTPDRNAVVTTGSYETREAFLAAAEVGREMGATPDGISDLEIRPRQVHFLESR
ncbi:antibiotic biosynthesis monooxygenase family protein [Streptomyces sp. NPDC085524]|uniref:antibiotic biosynthesis monooxygenase family protein n=1 Tax=Streptomyces sp. NPDC085524 TaxID=3365728 RepID=UPI0037CEEBEB